MKLKNVFNGTVLYLQYIDKMGGRGLYLDLESCIIVSLQLLKQENEAKNVFMVLCYVCSRYIYEMGSRGQRFGFEIE